MSCHVTSYMTNMTNMTNMTRHHTHEAESKFCHFWGGDARPVGTTRGIDRCSPFGVNVVPMPNYLPRARVKRCGKDWYLPKRLTESDRQRDQELLSQIPSVSRAQVERDLVAVETMREEEMGSGGSADCRLTSSTVKRARRKRNGIEIYLLVRSSAAEQERGQQFLDSIDRRLSPGAVGLRVEEIEAQRHGDGYWRAGKLSGCLARTEEAEEARQFTSS